MTLKIQRPKQHTPNLKYNREFGATTGVCLRLIESADPEDGLKECIKGDTWFESVRACVALGGRVTRLSSKSRGIKAFTQKYSLKSRWPPLLVVHQL
jgi:hypothetical protein